MPLYDVKCETCGATEERFIPLKDFNLKIKCNCGNNMTRLMSPPHKDWFRPHWNENFDLKPIYVESKSHYKQLCKQYGVYSKAL